MDRKYLKQWLLTIGILFLVGMALAYDLYREHRRTESLEYDRLLVQTRVINETLNRQLASTYRSMQRILNDLPHWRAGDSYMPAANVMLKALDEAIPGVRTFVIIDAKGIARASNRAELVGRDLSQREYFTAVRRYHDPDALYLSPPYTTVLNVYTMNLSLMIPGPAGEFNGIIVATLDTEYFRTLLASVQYAPDMWVAVAHGDGVQFIMVPDREGQSGKNLAQPGSFFSRHQESGKNENVMTGRVYATGEERIMAIRTILPAGIHLDKPLVVAIGRDINAVFADWRTNAMIYGSLFSGIGLVTVFFLRLNQISVRRTDELAIRAKEALEKSEKKYRLLIESLQEGIWLIDKDGNTTFVNQSMAQMLGYSVEEMQGKHLFSLMDERGRTDAVRQLENRKQGIKEQHDFEFLHKDGRRIYTTLAASPILDESGNYAGALAGVMNITERRRTEEELREREKQLTESQRIAHIGSWEHDLKTGNVVWSDELFRLLGLDPRKDPADFRIFFDMIHPDDRQAVKKAIDETMETGKQFSIDYRFILRDGASRVLHAQAELVRNAAGDQAVLRGTAQDITERKLAEEALEQSEKKIRDITASLGEGLYVLNDNGEVTFMNPEAERLLGWTEAELRGKNVHDVVHSRKPDGTPLSFDACRMHNVIRMGSRYFSHDEMFIRKDKTTFPVSVISAPLIEAGGVTSTVTAFRDISDIKHAEQEREKLIADLQKALAEIKTLRGILPICSYCKKIRDDKGAWTQLEAYISQHTDALFSHGICKECAAKLYPRYYKEDEPEGER